MYIFFDTETTGVPKDYKAPLTDFNNWPRLVQLAFLVTDDNGVIIAGENIVIKPEGFEIPESASAIHGITTEMAMKEGKDLERALKLFSVWAVQCKVMVGHNISFDRKIVGSELLRKNLPDVLHEKARHCTMMESTKYCQIPAVGRNGYKWPKLSELHLKLFGTDFQGAHDASNDIAATHVCFWELKKLGVIKEKEVSNVQS